MGQINTFLIQLLFSVYLAVRSEPIQPLFVENIQSHNVSPIFFDINKVHRQELVPFSDSGF